MGHFLYFIMADNIYNQLSKANFYYGYTLNFAITEIIFIFVV